MSKPSVKRARTQETDVSEPVPSKEEDVKQAQQDEWERHVNTSPVPVEEDVKHVEINFVSRIEQEDLMQLVVATGAAPKPQPTTEKKKDHLLTIEYQSKEGHARIRHTYTRGEVEQFAYLIEIWEKQEAEGWDTHDCITVQTNLSSGSLAVSVGMLHHLCLSPHPSVLKKNVRATGILCMPIIELSQQLGTLEHASVLDMLGFDTIQIWTVQVDNRPIVIESDRESDAHVLDRLELMTLKMKKDVSAKLSLMNSVLDLRAAASYRDPHDSSRKYPTFTWNNTANVVGRTGIHFPRLARMSPAVVGAFMSQLPMLDFMGQTMLFSVLSDHEKQALKELVWDQGIWEPKGFDWYIHGGMAMAILRRAYQIEMESRQKGLSLGALKQHSEQKFVSRLEPSDIDIVVVVPERTAWLLYGHILQSFPNDGVYVVNRVAEGFIEVVHVKTSTRFQFCFAHDPRTIVAQHDMNIYRCMLNATHKVIQPGCIESIRNGRTTHDQAICPQYFNCDVSLETKSQWTKRILKTAMKGFTVTVICGYNERTLGGQSRRLNYREFGPKDVELGGVDDLATELEPRLILSVDDDNVTQRQCIARYFALPFAYVTTPSVFELSADEQNKLLSNGIYASRQTCPMAKNPFYPGPTALERFARDMFRGVNAK